jgi:hypothetical protein
LMIALQGRRNLSLAGPAGGKPPALLEVHD